MNVLVIGAAVSGRAAARLLQKLGHRVVVYDLQPSAVEGLQQEGFEVTSGEWSAGYLEEVELVVTSPGVPEHSGVLQDTAAAGVPLWSEIELAFRHLQAPVVAITGTNGKSTVTSLAAEMLIASGKKAAAAGNIGRALSDLVGEPWDVVVVEASSFQLRFVETFHPRVAAVLNVAPDHLDWHGSFQAYAGAKANVFRRQGDDDALIFDADDQGAAGLVARAASRQIPVSGSRRPHGGAGPEAGRLELPGASVTLEEVAVDDPAYLLDLAAAGTAALEAGATPEAVVGAIRSFRPGPHRRTLVGTWDGVSWVDDSKATNPHAAAASAAAHRSVVLVAGGRNKGLDLRPVVEAPTVRHVVAIGEAGLELMEAAGLERATMVRSMEEAVRVADLLARPGDTVLLAPGCASFDMFRSYGERGEAFAGEVLKRKSEPETHR